MYFSCDGLRCFASKIAATVENRREKLLPLQSLCAACTTKTFCGTAFFYPEMPAASLGGSPS
jgi:hypothetical protein